MFPNLDTVQPGTNNRGASRPMSSNCDRKRPPEKVCEFSSNHIIAMGATVS